MRDRLFTFWATMLVTRPGGVVLAGLLALALSVPLAGRLQLKAGRFDLVPPNDPTVVAYEKIAREFGTLSAVVLVASGTPEATRRFVDSAALELGLRPQVVRTVLHRIPLTAPGLPLLGLLGIQGLESLRRDLVGLGGLVVTLSDQPTLAAFLGLAVEEMTETEGPSPTPEAAAASLDFISAALESAASTLELGRLTAGRVALPGLTAASSPGSRGVDAQGYLSSSTGQHRLMILEPATPLDGASSVRRFLGELDQALGAARLAAPDVVVRLGGGGVGDLEEEATVESDLARTSLVASVGVLVLSTMAFRTVTIALVSSGVLTLCLLWTSAAAWLLVGHLNLISTVFVAILTGLGVDFGIYLVSQAADTGLPCRQALDSVLRQAGPGMLTGALTTVMAFVSLAGHEFVAFRELGLIAAAGIVLCFIGMLSVFPALVILLERWVWPRARSDATIGDRTAPRSPPAWARALAQVATQVLPEAGNAAPRALRQGPLRLAHPGPLALGVGVAVTVFLAVAASRVEFDYDMRHMLDPGLPSVRLELLLESEFGISSDEAVVLCTDVTVADRVARSLRAHRAVGVVESPSDLVGIDPSGLAKALRELRSQARGLPVPKPRGVPADVATIRTALTAMGPALAEPRRLVHLGGDGAPQLMTAIARLDRARTDLLGRLDSGPDVAAELGHFGDTMTTEIADRVTALAGLDERPPTLETLPTEIRRRFIGRSGAMAVHVGVPPGGQSQERLRAFVGACESVARMPGVTAVAGVPIIVYRMMELIRNGLWQAAGLALGAVALIVWFDLRRPRYALAALIPLACSGTWMAGSLGVTGASWNPLSALGVPVLSGVGIAFGVNLVHRLAVTPDVALALAGTGRAIFYSAATSAVGFGSLALAHHRGLAGFGLALAVGVTAAMAAALVLSPVLAGRPGPVSRTEDRSER